MGRQVRGALMKPKIIYATGAFMAEYNAEQCRKEWLDAGADWRRAKREARKVRDGSWREYQADRLERIAGLNPRAIGMNAAGIDRTAFSWWRNRATDA